MPTPINDTHDDTTCDDSDSDSESVLPVLLATGSAMLLGYLVGRVSYANDLRSVLRRIEESPEPTTVLIRTL
jgi:hypothetical protein